jgi:glycosyltransferase involved in cell wall biosynthesis
MHSSNSLKSPNLSVITLTRDDSSALLLTLRSILAQRTEYIYEVILCESWTRPSVFQKTLSAAALPFDPVIIRQFPPRGIYPAMNSALSVAQGELVIFLNSGDSFWSDSSLHCLCAFWYDKSLKSSCPPHAVFGQASMSAFNDRLQWCSPDTRTTNITRWLSVAWPCHQSVVFYRLWALRHLYSYDLGLSADSVVMKAALSRGARDIYFPCPVVRYDLSGVSSRPGSLFEAAILSRNLPPSMAIRVLAKSLLYPIRACYPFLIYLKARLLGLICSF